MIQMFLTAFVGFRLDHSNSCMVYISLVMKMISSTSTQQRLMPVFLLMGFLSPLLSPALCLHAGEIPPRAAEETQVQPSAGEKRVEGVAAYYAKRFNGRKTRSGARYDPEKMTAAHADFPLGTKVKVVNLANGREVIVTVNDRCRRKRMPFIDLSRAAARKLGFLGKGTARVVFGRIDGDTGH